MKRPVTGTIEHEHETAVDTATYTIQYRITPGEPMVWRDKNGDGYPGSPPECEVTGVVLVDDTVHPIDRIVVAGHFWDQIDADDDLRKRIEAACFEDANARCEVDR